MKFTAELENTMIESNLTRLIITDILSTDNYTLQGIATYTNTHIDVINEIASGRNTPNIALFKRIIDLHRSVRYELYDAIAKKIASECLTLRSNV